MITQEQSAAMDPQERIAFLQDNAYKVDKDTYMKPLTPEELDQRREQLSLNLIKLSEHEDELNEVKAEFKFKMEPLAKKNKVLLTEIKTRQVQADGHLYRFANHESGFMETYNAEGLLIETRRLRPEEKQTAIFQINKAS